MKTDPCILVIDDSHTMQRIIKTLLKQIGYTNVLEAATQDEGLKVLRQQKIDILICDAILPKLNGVELLKIVRDHQKMNETAVLLVTTSNEKKRLQETVEEFECSIITRPFTVQNLKEKLRKLTGAENIIKPTG